MSLQVEVIPDVVHDTLGNPKQSKRKYQLGSRDLEKVSHLIHIIIFDVGLKILWKIINKAYDT